MIQIDQLRYIYTLLCLLHICLTLLVFRYIHIHLWIIIAKTTFSAKKLVWRLSNFCKRAWFHRLYLSSWFVSSGQLVQFRCCIRIHVFVSVPDTFFCHNPPKYNCLRNHRVMITDKQSEGRVNGRIFNIMKTSSRHQMGTFCALLALCAGD